MSDHPPMQPVVNPLPPMVVALALAIFAVDVGECTVWIARQVAMHGERRMLGSFNHGSLGAALPVALGSSSLDPKRQVWAFCGDGGFGMAMQDLVTAVRYDWPVKILVFNNGELGFVKMEMEVAGDAFEAELRDFLAPNLSKIKMPKLFDFRPDLPREANGKLYKRELRDEFAAKAN